ncbi:hypothetical protein QYE77_14965 (plasmid) [Thermanaerothrix sp. 4228-RoL]|jgi:hypothetical protein|uniref:Uncharacterized protein n=1 Tax=Thermanaerothrix solaris TaxID=3058434 RepID=A0ABU3NRW4_9CHLR|nr:MULTISPECIES: hypothetical protein [unclassified Thermanaerothrix]MDT8899564.1 hypothetical protein [Thermanaerothrix sp. 4228-RoL]
MKNLIGWDEERQAYLFDYSPWITASPSLVTSGYQQHVFEKNGEYALPGENSYLFPFAKACGWQHVISFPSHHDIVSGPAFTATARFNQEFNAWFEQELNKPWPQAYLE